jgi:hypothetical protein
MRQEGNVARGGMRWIGISLLVCIAATLAAWVVDGVARLRTVEKISAVSFSETQPGSVSVSPGTREESLILPHSSIDARWWVIHARQMLREGEWRIRSTALDNAPEGREVHWSSLLLWVLSGLAWIRSIGTGQPAWHFTADAALAVGPLLMAVFFLGLVLVARRTFGLVPALLYLLALLTSNAVLRTFQLGEADHHGIVLALASGSVLCLLAGGSGFAKKGDLVAEWWFATAGLLGAAALWVSASTALPILAATGLGGLVAGCLRSNATAQAPLRPRLWLHWAGWGCAGSIGFYLLEYFPRHMGLRLEVNHPLYAMAWLGGGWILQRVLQATLDGRFPVRRPGDWVKAGLCVAAVAAPVVMIVLGGEWFFWVSDDFLLALHKEYILEFQSLAGLAAAKNAGWIEPVIAHVWVWIALGAASVLWVWGPRDPSFRAAILLLLPPTVVMQSLALVQVRWGSASASLWALWIPVISAALLRLPLGQPQRLWLLAGIVLAPWVALLLGPLPIAAASNKFEKTCLDAPLAEETGGNLLVRDIAHRLIQSSPSTIPTVLTGPNTSTELVFHSGLRTLGTLYWENMHGLKGAAAIFAATTRDEARRLLEEAGVTHIVVPSWSNFGAAYADLLAKAEGMDQAEPSYLSGVLESEDFPVWLRPFAYPIPTASGIDSQSVRIIAFLPGQNLFESWFHRGIYHMESGQPFKARAAFEQARAIRPGEPRVEMLLQRLPPQ